MNSLLPILVWFSLWAAVIVFGFMIILYLFLMLMGKEELEGLRAESDADMRDVRRAEQEAVEERKALREERRRALLDQRGESADHPREPD
jgi:ABC-type transport system involved in cytochrome bd biosynthesis fused ATPase/permease subunit